MVYSHKSVMLREVLEFLNPLPGQKFIDGTLGGAGYTLALADKVGRKGKVLAIDLDNLALENATKEIKIRKLENIILVQDNFKNLETIVSTNFSANEKFDGLVLDLGLSSAQLDDEKRGFSFKGDRPLNMAFGQMGDISAISTYEIVNNYSLLDLTKIFQNYGEERHAYRYAQAIVAGRRLKKIETTSELITLIADTAPFRAHSRIHPATKIFQALRIETNDELTALAEILPVVARKLKAGGRLVVVSFHSGEDRIVKRYLKNNNDWKILTKRPAVPTEMEIAENPRARSAKLRAAIKN